MKSGLSEETIQKINRVLSAYPAVEGALLYGSRAMGNYKNGSDIDLTLLGGNDLTLKVLSKIHIDLDDLLLPYQIDLSILKDIANDEVIEHILRVGIFFYERRGELFDNQPAPPAKDSMNEDEARELASTMVREVRQKRYQAKNLRE